jgi:Na+-translocating ferredoxin:NAD+ oxidoreductase RnfE subunit
LIFILPPGSFLLIGYIIGAINLNNRRKAQMKLKRSVA